jgi:hypothetical protein
MLLTLIKHSKTVKLSLGSVNDTGEEIFTVVNNTGNASFAGVNDTGKVPR